MLLTNPEPSERAHVIWFETTVSSAASSPPHTDRISLTVESICHYARKMCLGVHYRLNLIQLDPWHRTSPGPAKRRLNSIEINHPHETPT